MDYLDPAGLHIPRDLAGLPLPDSDDYIRVTELLSDLAKIAGETNAHLVLDRATPDSVNVDLQTFGVTESQRDRMHAAAQAAGINISIDSSQPY
jgi:hypothetical protein